MLQTLILRYVSQRSFPKPWGFTFLFAIWYVIKFLYMQFLESEIYNVGIQYLEILFCIILFLQLLKMRTSHDELLDKMEAMKKENKNLHGTIK